MFRTLLISTGYGVFLYSFVAQGGSIEGVMYLPYAVSDKGLHCLLNWADNQPESSIYVKNDFKGATYVIKWSERPAAPELLKARFAAVRFQDEIGWNNIL